MLKGKRKALAWLLHWSGAAAVTGAVLRRFGPRRLTILAYHGVAPADAAERPFAEWNISATAEQFESQLRFVQAHYRVITFADLAAEPEGAGEGREPLIITFDDGYRNNYSTAFPLLQKYALHATFFLATGHLESRRLFWFDRLSYLIGRTEVDRIQLETLDDAAWPLDSAEARARARLDLKYRLQQAPNRTRLEALDELQEKCGVAILPDAGDRMLLTWDQVKEMHAAGMEFGAHTVTHPVMSRLTEEELEEEVLGCREAIAEHVGERPRVFCYPTGGAGHFGEREQDALRAAGYEYATSYVHGLSRLDSLERYALPRLRMETDVSFAQFRCNLVWPRLGRYALTG